MLELQRIMFDEYTESCLYHPQPGCVHPSMKDTAKFIGSLTHIGGSWPDVPRHAPALDIDFSASLEKLSDQETRVHIKGPKSRRTHLNSLFRCFAEMGIMSHDEATRLQIFGGLNRNDMLPEFVICVPAQLVPSSTPGHFHLYIDHEMEWKMYERLLRALCDARVIGKNFCEMSIHWKGSFLLKPGFTKKDLKLSFDQMK